VEESRASRNPGIQSNGPLVGKPIQREALADNVENSLVGPV
jgi:hypothetical protein